jgi:hypothetical protein
MFNRNLLAIVVAGFIAFVATTLGTISQVVNPGVPVSGSPSNNDCAKFVVSGGNVQSITTAGAACGSGGGGTPANPTATAGPAAINGSATTYMRSDAAPAVQKGTNSQFGIVESDGSTITCTSGVCVVASLTFGGQTVAPGGSASVQGNGALIQLSTGAITTQHCVKFDANGNTVDAGAACNSQTIPTGANPTATAGPAAVNGSAATFMRSDGAPAVQKATNGQFGIIEGDGSTITLTAGVASCTTATTSQLGCVEPDGTTVTISGGVISSTGGATGHNPTATAGPSAVNGSATTYMRSDGAPAVQVGSSSQEGILQCGTGTSCSGGTISAPATLPTVQTFTSGTSQTYTTPAGVQWIEVSACGGGAGGSGTNTTVNSFVAGTAGNSTTFNSVVAAGGGVGSGTLSGAGGTGGTGTATRRMAGQSGGNGDSSVTAALEFTPAGPGGSSVLLGGGARGVAGNQAAAGNNGVTNTGGGGGGAINNAGTNYNIAPGGGGGECFYLLINSPSATYTYTVGATAAGGSSTNNGGTGAAGYIQVIEHYI